MKRIFSEVEKQGVIRLYIQDALSLDDIGSNFRVSWYPIKRLLLEMGVTLRTKEEIGILRSQPDRGHPLNIFGNGFTQTSIMKKPAPKKLKRYLRTSIPMPMRFQILTRDSFRCRYCGRGPTDGVKLQVDHIVSVSDGGTTILTNLITACQDCNIGKFHRSVIQGQQIPSFLAIGLRGKQVRGRDETPFSQFGDARSVRV